MIGGSYDDRATMAGQRICHTGCPLPPTAPPTAALAGKGIATIPELLLICRLPALPACYSS